MVESHSSPRWSYRKKEEKEKIKLDYTSREQGIANPNGVFHFDVTLVAMSFIVL
jgi:hypothetical protein